MSTAWVAPGAGATLAELQELLRVIFANRIINKREMNASQRHLERLAQRSGWNARTKLRIYDDGHLTRYTGAVRIAAVQVSEVK